MSCSTMPGLLLLAAYVDGLLHAAYKDTAATGVPWVTAPAHCE